MKLAHIAPTAALRSKLFEHLDFHMVIASQVLKDAAYAEYYRNAAGYVLLDVPTHEEKDLKAYSIDSLVKAIRLVQPSEVVLPDIWKGSVTENIEAARYAAGWLNEIGVTSRGVLKYMVVPWGSTYEEYEDCVLEMARIPRVVSIGVTEGSAAKLGMANDEFILRLRELLPGYDLHLLGVLPDLSDIQNKTIRANVRSADTAKLVVFGLDCRYPTYGNVPEYKGRGENYFEQKVTELQLSYIAKNIRYWDKLAASVNGRVRS